MTTATKLRRQENPERARQILKAIRRVEVECPECEGAGIFFQMGGVTNPNIMEPPEWKCWACNGEGEISLERKRRVNHDRNFSYEEIKEAYLLEKHGL